MKIILKLIMMLGFVIMIGTAGSVDNENINLATAFVLELCGIAVVLLGYSALCHYKRYVRRNVKRLMHGKKMQEKELCR